MSAITDLISATATRLGVPPSIALAVAQRESGFNQNARGAAGEIGVFQLMPGTAAGLGVNPYDLNQNVEGGIKYLADNYQRFGDWELALQAYNGGPGHVSAGTVSSAAKGYASAVLAASGIASGSTPVTDTSGGAVLASDWPWTDWTGETAGLSTGAILALAGVFLVGVFVVTD
jgi:soluble lytic murein transglycosylase-like protein